MYDESGPHRSVALAGIGGTSGLGMSGGMNPLLMMLSLAFSNPQAFSQLLGGQSQGQPSSAGTQAGGAGLYPGAYTSAQQVLGMNNPTSTLGPGGSTFSNMTQNPLSGLLSMFGLGGSSGSGGMSNGLAFQNPTFMQSGTVGGSTGGATTQPSLPNGAGNMQRYAMPVARQGMSPYTQGYVGAGNTYQSPNQGGYGGFGQSEMTNPGMGYTSSLFGSSVGMPSMATLFPSTSQPSIGALTTPTQATPSSTASIYGNAPNVNQYVGSGLTLDQANTMGMPGNQIAALGLYNNQGGG